MEGLGSPTIKWRSLPKALGERGNPSEQQPQNNKYSIAEQSALSSPTEVVNPLKTTFKHVITAQAKQITT